VIPISFILSPFVAILEDKDFLDIVNKFRNPRGLSRIPINITSGRLHTADAFWRQSTVEQGPSVDNSLST